MVTIITDSTADLGPEISSEFGLCTIPLNVTIGGSTYKDGLEIDQQKLFGLVKQHGELPKTSAPSVGEFTRMFDQPGDHVFIGISSKLSATIQNALLAAASFPAGKVRVIDSLNLSTGVGLLALRAAELRDAGFSAQQIELELLVSIPKVRTSFIIDTMDYLYKGGRCTAIQAIAGSVLKIHPVIDVRSDGTLGVKEKARGVRSKGFQMMLNDFQAHVSELDRKRVFITYTGETDADACFLADEIKRIAEPDEVLITKAGSVISSHCGPDTIGILYLVK